MYSSATEEPKPHHSCAPCKRRVVFFLTLCLVGGGWAWWKISGDQKEILRLREVLREERLRSDALEQVLAYSHQRTQARMDLLLQGTVATEKNSAAKYSGSSPAAPPTVSAIAPPIPRELLRIASSARSAQVSDSHSSAKPASVPAKPASVVFRVLGIRGINLVYQGYDGVHVASPGEALHGVDGAYLGYDRKAGRARVRLRKKEVLLPAKLLENSIR